AFFPGLLSTCASRKISGRCAARCRQDSLAGRLRHPLPQRRASRSHSLRLGTTLYEGFVACRWVASRIICPMYTLLLTPLIDEFTPLLEAFNAMGYYSTPKTIGNLTI